MIHFSTGSLFDGGSQTIVNPVNTVGVSGAGLAKDFKKRYPKAQRSYEKACREGFRIGEMLLWQSPEKWVLFLPTKEHWREPSELFFVERGLTAFVRDYAMVGITSVAFPALGCGNGGLDWADVKPMMTRFLGDLPIPVTIHAPLPVPAHKGRKARAS